MRNEKDLRRRSRRAFFTAGVSALAGVAGWRLLRESPDADGIPSAFRRALEAEGRFWRAFYRPDRAPTQPEAPPVGAAIRLNGHLGLSGAVDPARWRLRVVSPADFPGKREIALTLADLRAMPRSESVTEFKCIEGWTETFAYAGVRFSDLTRVLGVGARSGRTYPHVGLETPDREYYVSIDTESMLHPQTLLSYEMNGRPLSAEHGAPLRLVIPVKYGIKSLKRVGLIRFAEPRPPDYWAERGYDWFAGL